MVGPPGPDGPAGPVVDLAELVTRVLDGPSRLGGVRLVGVDGPSGSGKTTLAGRLRAAFHRDPRRPRASVVHLDNLYEGWSGVAADRGHGTVSQRLREDLLDPLAAGRPGRWRRYDWHAAAFAEWHEVAEPDVLLLEGCGSVDPAYSAHLVLSIWVEAARELRTSRGLARGGVGTQANMSRWQAGEDALFGSRNTRALADLRVDGAPAVAHDPARQLVLLD